MLCCPMATSKRNNPKHDLEALGMCFLADILDFFETEEG